MEENSEYVHLVTHHQRRFRISPEARHKRAAGWHAVNFHTQAVLATFQHALDVPANDRHRHCVTPNHPISTEADSASP